MEELRGQLVMDIEDVELAGLSLIAGHKAEPTGLSFRGVNPANALPLEPAYYTASLDDIDSAARLAADAFPPFAKLSGRERAEFLRKIAEGLTAAGAAIVERANAETGLPVARLQGELARTTGQLKLFAELIEEGSWVDARIDEADRERKPIPRADVRSMLRPIGPVAIFGASNFPLAFSVAGGDTASALAAGNPVIVKAHPAHPGTSEIVGKVIQDTARACGLPDGVFALLFDAGTEVGTALVEHPDVRAVAFTGSATAGQALMRLASQRPEPIPCYSEMGSSNPLFILPGAIRERGPALAQALQSSFTLGSGQFCTKPGLVFVPEKDDRKFMEALRNGVNSLEQQGMLTAGIATKYKDAVLERLHENKAQNIAGTAPGALASHASCSPLLFEVTLRDFLKEPSLEEEIFGPTTLLVRYGSGDELLAAARQLHGHLTATIHGTDEDLSNAGELVRVLEGKVGRILYNGFPTGVEVCHAMVHGGPFPATSDGRSTSVGTRAIFRFTRPVCYQDFPDASLPLELQQTNPLQLMRMVNGNLKRD